MLAAIANLKEGGDDKRQGSSATPFVREHLDMGDHIGVGGERRVRGERRDALSCCALEGGEGRVRGERCGTLRCRAVYASTAAAMLVAPGLVASRRLYAAMASCRLGALDSVGGGWTLRVTGVSFSATPRGVPASIDDNTWGSLRGVETDASRYL